MSYSFVIVGSNDNLLYEYEFGTYKQGGDGTAKFPEGSSHMNQLVLHASLDVIEKIQWEQSAIYLKSIDQFYNYSISVYLTPSNVRLMLLHDTKYDEPIRQFFVEVYDLYTKTVLNPFYEINSTIASGTFDAKVKGSAKKYL